MQAGSVDVSLHTITCDGVKSRPLFLAHVCIDPMSPTTRTLKQAQMTKLIRLVFLHLGRHSGCVK